MDKNQGLDKKKPYEPFTNKRMAQLIAMDLVASTNETDTRPIVDVAVLICV